MAEEGPTFDVCICEAITACRNALGLAQLRSFLYRPWCLSGWVDWPWSVVVRSYRALSKWYRPIFKPINLQHALP
jgi:hypothetical protein